jgi:hypothetical protein
MQLEFSRQIFEKYSHTTFHENPFSGTDGQTDRQTDMAKLIVEFRNFAKAPIKEYLILNAFPRQQ